MILGLGSRSPESRWVPLPGVKPDPDSIFEQSWEDEEVPEIDWDSEKKCICIMIFLVSKQGFNNFNQTSL